MNIICKILDLATFLAGSVMFLFGVFSFRTGSAAPSYKPTVIYYYYDKSDLNIIAIGGGLIVLGFLLRSWTKNIK